MAHLLQEVADVVLAAELEGHEAVVQHRNKSVAEGLTDKMTDLRINRVVTFHVGRLAHVSHHLRHDLTCLCNVLKARPISEDQSTS